ncbi:MAG: DUF488 domain-containing protein [Chloroflexi bacterium]|nr:DUF488 domain-containing protein [Chloroflexota bacterium]MYB84617.1 DUF488 domain-containing protein [Chloroflexota bacterium]
MNTTPNPVFTVGHSNHPLEVFISLLCQHGIAEVADVRSSPYTRSPYTAHFGRDAFEGLLGEHGIRYVYMGAELGGRPADRSCYDTSGRVLYERLAQTDDFLFGVQNLLRDADQYRIALMCSEKEPLDCHRTLLVAHALTTEYGVDGNSVQHILADGRLESHRDAMQRLLDSSESKKAQIRQYDMFAPSTGSDEVAELIDKAVRQQAARVAYVTTPWPTLGPDEEGML